MLLVRGAVTLIWVRFKYDLSVDPWALMRGEEVSLGAERLMSAGRCCLIRGLTVEAGNDLWVKKRLPHLLVLPGCRLPHHLQLLLYFPERGEKTQMWCHSSASECRSLQHTRVLMIACNCSKWAGWPQDKRGQRAAGSLKHLRLLMSKSGLWIWVWNGVVCVNRMSQLSAVQYLLLAAAQEEISRYSDTRLMCTNRVPHVCLPLTAHCWEHKYMYGNME